jgi:hypothetical protein
MNFEAAAHRLTDRYRLSPVGFNEPQLTSTEAEADHLENPAEHINPLGAPVEALTLFAFGDTHFHVPERSSFDRTAVLPTTVVMGALRGNLRKQHRWHQAVRPTLYNDALADWPNQLAYTLEDQDTSLGEHALIVHTGDVGDDSLNRTELVTAMNATARIIGQLKDTFDTYSEGRTRAVAIQGIGDHDADYRAWPMAVRADQVHWFYGQLGLDEQPACFLQEIGNAENPDKAVLVVDTNLMEDAWIEEARQAATRGIARLTGQIDPSLAPDFDVTSFGNDPSLRDIVLYHNIMRNKVAQDRLIGRAQAYNETILLGHKPNVLLKIAKDCEGDTTIVAGHWHIPYNSDKVGSIHLPTQRSKNGSAVRMLVVAPPTRGMGGLEVAGKPAAYMLHLSAGKPLKKEDVTVVGSDVR